MKSSKFALTFKIEEFLKDIKIMIDDQVLRDLKDSMLVRNMITLNLEGMDNLSSSKIAEFLTENPWLQKLRNVNLSGTAVENDDFAVLSKKIGKNLETMKIRGCKKINDCKKVIQFLNELSMKFDFQDFFENSLLRTEQRRELRAFSEVINFKR